MSNVHKHMLNIYNGIYVAAMSLTIHMLIGSYTGIPYMYGFLAVFIIMIATAFEYLSCVKPAVGRKIITAVVFLYLIVVFITIFTCMGNGVSVNIAANNQSVETEVSISAGCRLLISIVSAVFITFICKLTQRISYVANVFPCFLIIFIIGARISGVIVELEVLVLALYVFIITACRVNKEVHYMFMTPVIMLFCAVLYIIPTGTEPMSWKNVWGVIEVAGNTITDMWSDMMKATGLDRFDSNVKRIGYSDAENIDIVDEIVGNNRTQLLVVGRQCASSIYLRGSYYNIYNGEGWQRSFDEASYPEYDVMLFETLNNIINYGTSKYKYLINNISRIKIQYKGLQTDNVFVPYNAVRRDMQGDVVYDNGVLKFTDKVKEDDYYKVWYFNMNEDALAGMYENNEHKSYNSALDIVKFADAYADCNIVGTLDNVSLGRMDRLLARRSNYVKKNYTNIPECVPQRVYDLAKEITAGASSDYDKVKCIEKYLNQNYKYNKKVTRTYEFGGKNECSVDDFLFDTKEGSCMHYASALAVLARCIGIPSRITTGYCMRYNDDTGEWVEHSVVGGEGHAWPEVYMGVTGWMRLDPTPSYYEKAYLDDGLNEKDEVVYTSGKGTNIAASGTMQPDTHANTSKPQPSPVKKYVKNTARPSGVPTSATDNTSGSIYIFIIILIICIITVVCIMCIIIRHKIRNVYYNNLDNADKCSKIIDGIMHKYNKDMKKSGKRSGLGNCTLNESIDIMSEWLGDERDNYEKVIKAYQGKIFGGIIIDRHTVRQAERLLARLQKKKNK